MIIVLSPSSQILLPECLTGPTGKSFTLHLLRQPPHERSFYLPASVSHSFCLSNCSLCSRCLSFAADEKSLTFFLTISPRRSVISTHLGMISWEPAHMLSVYLTCPNHGPSLFLRLSDSRASVSVSFSACVIVPLKDPLFSSALV